MIRRALRQFDFAANHVAGIARVLSPEGTFTAVCHEYRWRGERRVQGDPRSGRPRAAAAVGLQRQGPTIFYCDFPCDFLTSRAGQRSSKCKFHAIHKPA